MAGSGGGRWRRAVAVVVAGALALLLGGTLLAQTPTGQGPVTGMIAVVTDPEGLNLRAGPGTEFTSITVLPQGTELLIVGERKNINWLPVVYGTQPGYVHDAYVRIRPASSPSPTPTGRTSTVANPTPTPSTTVSPNPAPAVTPGPSGTPTASASPSPNGSSPGSPAPSPSASPSPRPSPAATPQPPLVDNGVLLLGVFASDDDGMITIADQFNLVAAVRPPDGVTSVTMRLSGAPFLSASSRFDVQPGAVSWLQIPTFRVDTENEPVLQEEILRKVGGTIPIRDGALVLAIDYTDATGAGRTASFQPTVFDFNNPGQIAKIEYPDLKRATGLPPEGAGVDNFYLRGDLDFHHPDDYYVRKLAVEMGRRGGAFPDDPELVADNVFLYINSLLGDSEPGDFNNDYNLARLIEDGTIKRGQSNGGYICIGQTYFMTAMTRTLGLPTRELNILVGRAGFIGNDGLWRVTWWQEGAVYAWYNGGWNHYDLWLGFKGAAGYFQANLVYQLGKAYDRRAVPFFTSYGAPTGLAGHDFGPNGQDTFDFDWPAVKPGVAIAGIDTGPPETAGSVDETAHFLDPGAALRLGRIPPVAQPPARVDIAGPPETRP